MQISIAHKTKQFFSLVIKLAIVIGAAYFIYDTLANNSNLDFKAFVTQLETSGVFKITTISILLVATFLNWLLEIIKWKTLVSSPT